VANEVRIFPLVMLDGIISPYVDEIIAFFQLQKCYIEVQPVNYEFQRNANKMLVIKNRK
jgi:hypothetical protein